MAIGKADASGLTAQGVHDSGFDSGGDEIAATVTSDSDYPSIASLSMPEIGG
jgi:hypothetical protein